MGLPTTELCLGPGPISVGFGTPASRPKIEDLVERLEEEMRKIESFKRELPLSLSIVKQVVDAMKEELVRWGEEGGRSKIVHHPILEEFLPVFTSSFQPEEGEEENETRWMSSDRPWSSHGDGVRNDSDDENAVRFAKSFKGFPSFCGTHEVPDGAKKVAVSLPDLSLFTPGIDGSPFVSSVPKEPKSCPPHAKSKPLVGGSLSASTSAPANGHGQTQQQTAAKKPRRCWSPELHGKFVGALKQLGGSHVATPKQIREMMMVDGLTNDEVKSHLQKYRLHIQKHRLDAEKISKNYMTSMDRPGIDQVRASIIF